MGNAIDYIKWRGDLSFDVDKINEIDMSALAEIAILNLDGIASRPVSLSEAYEKYTSMGRNCEPLGLIIPKEINELFSLLAHSPRYKDVVLSCYTQNITDDDLGQFSALVMENKNTRLIAFSGTDDTIIGWQENLNMALPSPTPAQRQSVDYLTSVIKSNKKNYVIGHSKGGNLAMYSYVHSPKKVKNMISHVYSLDGPGMRFEKWDEDVKDHITEIVPQDSVVGRFFNHYGTYKIVHSTNTGINQHDILSWQVECNSFVPDEQTKASQVIKESFDDLLEKLGEQQVIEFIDAVNVILRSGENKTLTDLDKDKGRLLTGVFALSPKQRRTMYFALKNLLAVKELRDSFFFGMRENLKENNK